MLLHCGAVPGCQPSRLGEPDLPVPVHGEHPIDPAAVEVDNWQCSTSLNSEYCAMLIPSGVSASS
jgi:hypothetical protein